MKSETHQEKANLWRLFPLLALKYEELYVVILGFELQLMIPWR